MMFERQQNIAYLSTGHSQKNVNVCSCSECYAAHSAQLLQFPVWFLGMYSVHVKVGQIIPLCDTHY